MTRAVMQQAINALEIARDLAAEQINALHASLGDRRPLTHKAARLDMEQIDAAADALRAALAQQPAPVAQPSDEMPWSDCEAISDKPVVDEALRALLADPTGDNATWVVREVARAVLALRPVAQPLTPEQIAVIVREAASGAATRRDGTTSTRIVRLTERAHKIGCEL